ncbi:MAG TPA: hypothetical protein VEQ59_04140, partial [Polyangiaceae bacterium]|nr:hypothetical protein [Polyangiaceae bacterium]
MPGVETGSVDPPVRAAAVAAEAVAGVLAAGPAGKPVKTTFTEKVGSPPEQPPAAEPELELEPDFVELCSCTSLAPSMRRRRWSVW